MDLPVPESENNIEALDGNAIAGQLIEVFGTEMTTVSGRCAACGQTAQIAELTVYSQAPGKVARCPTCAAVVIVLVDVRGEMQLHLDGFVLLDPPDAARRA